MKPLITVLTGCAVLCWSALSRSEEAGLYPVVTESWREWHVLAIVPESVEKDPVINAAGARLENIHAMADKNSEKLYLIELIREENAGEAALTVSYSEAPEETLRCRLPLGLDLTRLEWEKWHADADTGLADIENIPEGDHPWKALQLPDQWEEKGVTWIRTRFSIPADLKGTPLWLRLAAVDDADSAFLNGVPIGSTQCWDCPRNYPLPEEAVRWGEENELYIAVDNVNAGGGIYRTPLTISDAAGADIPVLFSDLPVTEEKDRAAPGPIGNPLPLRRLIVRDGVLRYEDGGEAALWGVNYYAQSWTQYNSLKAAGIDHKRAVNDDLDDLQAMGINILRIHVFDTEISDGKGNLIRNDHLDILDWLVAECVRRQLYLMLTPIAWWGSPSERDDSFSRNTPKEAMTLWRRAWPAQQEYLRQFLSHVNPYTGRALVKEPCLRLFEIINEPAYWRWEEVRDRRPGITHMPDSKQDAILRALNGVRADFEAYIPSPAWRGTAVFNWFRYQTLREYINTMAETMRGAGADQPIAYFRTWWQSDPGIFQAIADSRCDAITIGAYPGGLPSKPVNDRRNLLPETAPWQLESCFNEKARLVYEFDATGNFEKVQLYPAIARQFRGLGVQAASQFQYDSLHVAAYNPDWATHYLNLRHTPEKAVSFMIAGEVFRHMPRGRHFIVAEDHQVFGNAAVSFEYNTALFCSKEVYMQARQTDWHPFTPPEQPARIVAVGSTPYYEYGGSGVVMLRFEENTASLTIYPDVEKHGTDRMTGTPEKPLTTLHENTHALALLYPGWDRFSAEKKTESGWQPISVKKRQFNVSPGEYRLHLKY